MNSVPCTVTFTFRCNFCETDTTSEPEFIPNYGAMRLPVLPRGWRQVNSLLICNKHEVKLKVSGAPDAEFELL